MNHLGRNLGIAFGAILAGACAAPGADIGTAEAHSATPEVELCTNAATDTEGYFHCAGAITGEISAGQALSIVGRLDDVQRNDEEYFVRVRVVEKFVENGWKSYGEMSRYVYGRGVTEGDDGQEAVTLPFDTADATFHLRIGAARAGTYWIETVAIDAALFDEVEAAEEAMNAFNHSPADVALDSLGVSHEIDFGTLNAFDYFAELQTRAADPNDALESWERNAFNALGEEISRLDEAFGSLALAANLGGGGREVTVVENRSLPFDVAAVVVKATKQDLSEDNYGEVPTVDVTRSFGANDTVWVQIAMRGVTVPHGVRADTGAIWGATEGPHWVMPESVIDGSAWSWGSVYFTGLRAGSHTITPRIYDANARWDCDGDGFPDEEMAGFACGPESQWVDCNDDGIADIPTVEGAGCGGSGMGPVITIEPRPWYDIYDLDPITINVAN